jgi:hypothetical protein
MAAGATLSPVSSRVKERWQHWLMNLSLLCLVCKAHGWQRKVAEWNMPHPLGCIVFGHFGGHLVRNRKQNLNFPEHKNKMCSDNKILQ